MSRTYIPRALRQLTEERAKNQCEYCLVHKDDAIIPHEPDHIISEQHEGKTELENPSPVFIVTVIKAPI